VEMLMDFKIPMQDMPSEVPVSDVLTEEEKPVIYMKIPEVRQPKIERGASFHEKKDKNKKVNIKVTRADKMKEKYGKRYEKKHNKHG